MPLIRKILIDGCNFLAVGSSIFRHDTIGWIGWNGLKIEVYLNNGVGNFSVDGTAADLDAYLATGTVGGGAGIPSGLIAMWSGLLSALPAGWLLCDGLNGTPDLRSKFVKGSAPGIDPGATGGSATHSHAAHGYTPAGSISVATFSGTPANTSLVSAGTPAGSNSAPAFSGTQVVSSSDSAGTPAGTNSAPLFTGSAMAAHAHELPFSKAAGGTGALKMLAPTIFGSGTSRAPESISAAPTANSTAAVVALSEAKSAGTPAGTVAAPVFTGAPLAGHTHTVTAAGTVVAPVFTGAPLGTHQHTVTATGTVSGQTFAGTPDSLGHDTASNEPVWYGLAFIMKI